LRSRLARFADTFQREFSNVTAPEIQRLFFLTPSNTNSPQLPTDLVSSKATTNAVVAGTANQSSQVRTNLPTSIKDAPKLATMPSDKLAAKQVRADLVDAIIFVK
jgi:hypothetical protein